MDLLYMFPFLRSVLVVCALFSSILSVLLVFQLVIFRRVAAQDRTRFSRLATVHKTLGSLLAFASILASIVLWTAVFLIDRNIEFGTGSGMVITNSVQCVERDF
jgi:hypothetical protein